MGVKMSDESEGQQGAQYKLKQTRSASYPSVSLKVAIEKIAILYKEATTHLVPLEFAAKKWGYAVKSSSFLKLIAALGSYGLVDFQGTGLKKQLKVNTFGERIVEKGPDWESFLRNAACQPKPFKKILEKFATKGGSLPSKEILIEKLKWDDDFKFNKEVIGRIATIFMDTIDYAKLDGPAIMPPQQEEGAEKNAPVLHDEPLQVGDYVQWTINEMDQFKPPAQIKRFSLDGKWAFFDSAITNAGAPIEQLTREELSSAPVPPTSSSPSPASPMNPAQTGAQTMKQYSIPVGGGADAVLLVPQPMTAKMYGKLKTVIDLYEDVLVENEDAQAQGSSSPTTPDDDQKE